MHDHRLSEGGRGSEHQQVCDVRVVPAAMAQAELAGAHAPTARHHRGVGREVGGDVGTEVRRQAAESEVIMDFLFDVIPVWKALTGAAILAWWAYGRGYNRAARIARQAVREPT